MSAVRFVLIGLRRIGEVIAERFLAAEKRFMVCDIKSADIELFWAPEVNSSREVDEILKIWAAGL